MVAYNQNLGMNPVKSLADNPYSGNFLWYPIANGYASSIFIGSPVTISSGNIVIGATNTAILGAARAFKDFTTGGTGIVAPSPNQGVVPTTLQQYWVGGTTKPTGVQTYVAVQVDTMTLYDMQSNATDEATGFAATQLMIGANFSAQTGFSAGSGNTSTGYSTAQIKHNGGSPAATTNFQIIGLSPNLGNAWGVANNNVLVKINASILNAALSI
jgi:hypothetical protein